MSELLNIKKKLHQLCSEKTKQQIDDLKAIIQEAQDAANNETKSSAGDKHETGRAMAQLETEKLMTQLTEVLKLEQALSQINPEAQCKQVCLGALVITNNGSFYLAASLGKLEIDNTIYFAISTASPIGQQLIGLKPTDQFSFNERKYIIEKVE